MSRLGRDGTAELISRDQVLRHAREQGNINFPCLADHEQDWQPYPVDPFSAICDDHTYIHRVYIHTYLYGIHNYKTIIVPCRLERDKGSTLYWKDSPMWSDNITHHELITPKQTQTKIWFCYFNEASISHRCVGPQTYNMHFSLIYIYESRLSYEECCCFSH